MKTVRLKNNIVFEIIPDYALPVEKWYGADFAAMCMEVPDEVDQHWVYDPETSTFSPPPMPPEPEEPEEVEPPAGDEGESEVTADELMDILLGVSE